MSDKLQNLIGFQLVDITTEQFATVPDEFNMEDGPVSLQTQIGFDISRAGHILSVFTKFHFFQNDKASILISESGCHFLIGNDTWNNQTDESSTSISFTPHFLTHLLVLSVGTARGIIHANINSRKKKNGFDDLVLPTINVSDMVKEPQVFSLITDEEE